LVVSLSGGSIEIGDFGADVNNCAPLNYSVFTRQVQLGQVTISGGITSLLLLLLLLLLVVVVVVVVAAVVGVIIIVLITIVVIVV
jgi:type IV secretory pathway VirB6-like protein